MTPPRIIRRRPLPSADSIGGNEDLVTQILIRLPAKSLCRFKSVSKHWYSFISHPDFSRLRMPYSISGLFLSIGSRVNRPVYKYFHLAGKQTMDAPFKSLTFVDDPLGIKIVHSCNGVLLCSSIGCDYNHVRNFYIYNPTTKQFATIPPCNVSNQVVCCTNFLAFDPCRTPHYKVVLGCQYYSWKFQIHIYSSETGSWRPSGDLFTPTGWQQFKNGVFLNGAIHWPNSKSETGFRFDVVRECIETMLMPPLQDGGHKRSIGYFGESRGHLHLIYGSNNHTSVDVSAPFDIFEMESDYSKWFVKYRVHLDAITTTFPERPWYAYNMKFSVLHLFRGEMEEDSSLVFYIAGMIISYNFKEKTLKKLCNLVQGRNAKRNLHSKGWACAHQYNETLFCI